MTHFLAGKDYPHVCSACRLAVDQCIDLVVEGEDTDDEEAPMTLAYDLGMLCGGKECVNASGDAEGKLKPLPVAVTRDRRQYYLDTRLLQVRRVNNPHDSLSFKDMKALDRWIERRVHYFRLMPEPEPLPPSPASSRDDAGNDVRSRREGR